MELRPTPENWRVALLTAIGASFLVLVGAAIAVFHDGYVALLITGIVIVMAAVATLAPAVGTLTASVDADVRGVTVRRFGFTSRYRWSEVASVRLVERMAKIPDGTQYHWFKRSRTNDLVAVPALELVDGSIRELPALAAPADGRRRAAANEHARILAHLRTMTTIPAESTPAASSPAHAPLSQAG